MTNEEMLTNQREQAEFNRRVKQLYITERDIMGVLDGSKRLTGLPEGSTFQRAFFDGFTNCFVLTVHHHSFPVVGQGALPEAIIDYRYEVNYHDRRVEAKE